MQSRMTQTNGSPEYPGRFSMYAAHSNWIEYEISEAERMGKTIIGIKPWGQERVPLVVQNASVCPVVGWNRASVVQAVRYYT